MEGKYKFFVLAPAVVVVILVLMFSIATKGNSNITQYKDEASAVNFNASKKGEFMNYKTLDILNNRKDKAESKRKTHIDSNGSVIGIEDIYTNEYYKIEYEDITKDAINKEVIKYDEKIIELEKVENENWTKAKQGIKIAFVVSLVLSLIIIIGIMIKRR